MKRFGNRSSLKKPRRQRSISTDTKRKKASLTDTKAWNALYCRTNGFMLGCFLSLIRFKFARDDFAIHRQRIHEFLAEVGVPLSIPASQPHYNRVADALQVRIAKACRARARELGDFTAIGLFSCTDALMRLLQTQAQTEFNSALRDAVSRILAKYKLDAKRLYDRFLASVRSEAEDALDGGNVHIKTFLSPAMELLTSAIEPLPADPSSAFVAMPFAPPYDAYFDLFYRPLAAQLECRAFRMWGGLSGETYVDLMLAVMRRCALVIADLSALNANVFYEFGVARGLEKKVVPVCQSRFINLLPANIANDQLLQVYSPREKEWPRLTVLRCAAQVSLKDFAVELEEQRVAGARWAPGKALPDLPSADEDIHDKKTVGLDGNSQIHKPTDVSRV